MSCWIEQYKTLGGIEGDLPNTVIEISRFNVQSKVYYTDDITVYNDVKSGMSWGHFYNLAKVHEVTSKIDGYWGEFPDSNTRIPFYKDLANLSESKQAFRNWAINHIYGEYAYPQYSTNYAKFVDACLPSDLPSSTYRNIYVYSEYDGAYHAIGRCQRGSGADIGGVFATPFVYNNSGYLRGYWNFCIAYKNPNYSNRVELISNFYIQANDLNIQDPSVGIFYFTISEQSYNTIPIPWEINELNARIGWNPEDGPYGGLGNSEGEGGPAEGTFDWTSDDLSDPPTLTYSAVDTGFTRIYNPTLAQLQDFARYMWTDTNIFNTVWSIIARYFEDPMEAFISLSLLPIAIPNTTDPVDVKMLFLSTGKSMYAATQQFVTVECGSVNLKEIYGSALDYAPNTKIDLFLPYIGTVPIDPDEVMNREIKLTYMVDICTGCCVAIVSVKLTKSDGTQAYYPLYQFSGNCAIQIPFTSSNMDRYVDATIKASTIALTAGAGVAAGAAGAAAAKADTIAAAASSNTAYAGASLASTSEPQFSGPTAGIDKAQYKLAKADAAGFNRLSTALRGASEGIGIITGAKPQFSHSAPFTANSGYMSYRVPFFIIKSPRLVNPDQYGKYNGYPSLTYQQFSGLTGYTEVQQVQLTNINATANELDEIQGLLKTGVIM